MRRAYERYMPACNCPNGCTVATGTLRGADTLVFQCPTCSECTVARTIDMSPEALEDLQAEFECCLRGDNGVC